MVRPIEREPFVQESAESSTRDLQLAELIATATNTPPGKIVQKRSCSGGCIHHAERIVFRDGREFFIKRGTQAADNFAREAAGLLALRQVGAIRVPQVIATGEIGHNEACIVLEFIESDAPQEEFFARLGTQFACLHRQTGQVMCGWETDNYLGTNRQPNAWNQDWVEFFSEHRLRFQLRTARQRGIGSRELFKSGDRVCERLERLLASPPEPACLLHGDLWSGNFLCGTQGEPVIFDPAVYYGHREADLAMPLLFGGFSDKFFDAYADTWPLEDGWRDRVELYKLYHLLNHLNLFGSGYLESCLSILRRFA